MSWGRAVHDGWVTEMVGPLTVPDAAGLLDPQAPWVLLLDHLPVQRHRWSLAHVPTHEGDVTEPRPMTVLGLRYDALLPTQEFLGLAPLLAGHGLTAMQFLTRPRDDVDWRDERPGPRLAKRKAHGLVVAVELPHAHEVAQVTTLSEESMDDALARSGW